MLDVTNSVSNIIRSNFTHSLVRIDSNSTDIAIRSASTYVWHPVEETIGTHRGVLQREFELVTNEASIS